MELEMVNYELRMRNSIIFMKIAFIFFIELGFLIFVCTYYIGLGNHDQEPSFGTYMLKFCCVLTIHIMI